MIKQWSGERCDAGPLVASAIGWWVNEIAPRCDPLDHSEEISDLGGFQCGAFDASFVEEHGGIEQTTKLEAASAREHGAQLGGALLLLVDPGEVGAWFERKHPRTPKRRKSACSDVVAKARPLEGRCTRFMERRRDDRQEFW